jgi:hypothetical protein
MCWSRLLIHATLVFFLIFKDASHLIIFYFQIVFGMRGRFVIALNPRASELARFIMEELIPFWTQMRSYYTSTVHDRLLAQIKRNLPHHPMLDPQLTHAQRLDLGMDHYWDYICDRFIRRRGFSLQLYSELVWVCEQELLYLPPFFVHSSGPHPSTDGYSIRGHIYIPSKMAGVAAEGQGKVYDIRGDRQMAPLARYFPAGASARLDMYANAVWHAYTSYFHLACLLAKICFF